MPGGKSIRRKPHRLNRHSDILVRESMIECGIITGGYLDFCGGYSRADCRYVSGVYQQRFVNMWQLRIHENGPCGAEGEEKARYPQGLRGTVDTFIVSCSAGQVKPKGHMSRFKARSLKICPMIPVGSRSSILRPQNTSEGYSGRLCGVEVLEAQTQSHQQPFDGRCYLSG